MAVICLGPRGSPELWHTSLSLQWGERRRCCLEVRSLRVGMGEDRMTEVEEGGMSDSPTDLGERLLILWGSTNVCFTQKKLDF